MNQGITIRARTIEECIRLALEHLGMAREDVQVEVLEEPGEMDVEEALVHVAPKNAPPAVVEEAPQAVEIAPVEVDTAAGPLQMGQQMLGQILQWMGFEAQITPGEYSVVSEESQLILDVTLPNERDSGLLIGRRGETLHQLQFLVNLMVSRKLRRWPYLLVDVEHYRHRRDDSLRDLAHRMADRVSHTQRPITLEAMSAYERRIIHLALRDESLVVTQSTGEGDSRKVVIYPSGWDLPPS
jgi:spoIIIJ-associated protein